MEPSKGKDLRFLPNMPVTVWKGGKMVGSFFSDLAMQGKLGVILKPDPKWVKNSYVLVERVGNYYAYYLDVAENWKPSKQEQDFVSELL